MNEGARTAIADIMKSLQDTRDGLESIAGTQKSYLSKLPSDVKREVPRELSDSINRMDRLCRSVESSVTSLKEILDNA